MNLCVPTPRYFGTDGRFWLILQSRVDFAIERDRTMATLDAVTPLASA